MPPTIVLVHGAFAESSSLDRVIRSVARRTTEIPGASHAITVSQPEATAQLILDAAAMPAAV